jgi:hypothetical protein
MAIKLKSVLKNQQLQLAFKALIFGGFLVLVKLGGLGVVPIIFFFLAAFLLYSRPLFNAFAFIVSFLILAVVSLIVLKIFPDEGSYFLLAVFFFSFLFYLFLGVKNLVFIDRAFWFNFFNLALFYAVFLIFFWADKSSFFAIKSLLLFLAALFLFRDSLSVSVSNYSFPQKRTLASWLLAFIILELVWVISLLPLGFINSANLAIISVFLLGDLTVNYFKGVLTRRSILIDVTLFVVLFLIIFGTTRWELR